jgi:hypothetical protein
MGSPFSAAGDDLLAVHEKDPSPDTRYTRFTAGGRRTRLWPRAGRSPWSRALPEVMNLPGFSSESQWAVRRSGACPRRSRTAWNRRSSVWRRPQECGGVEKTRISIPAAGCFRPRPVYAAIPLPAGGPFSGARRSPRRMSAASPTMGRKDGTFLLISAGSNVDVEDLGLGRRRSRGGPV